MKLKRLLSLLTIAFLLAAAGSAQVLQSSHQPVAKTPPTTVPAAMDAPMALVNGVAISRARFEQELRRVFPYYSMHGNAIPKEFEADVRQKALANLINEELVYQEAKRRNLQITPEEWRKRLVEIRKDYKSQAEFDAVMIRYFGTKKAFEEKLRHDMLLDKIYLLEVKQKAGVSAADVQTYYDKNKERYVQPESVSFQTISTLFPNNPVPADKQAARKRIEVILPKAKEAKNYEEFGVLAEKVSEDNYRVMMGDHKMAHRGTLAPEFEIAFSMKEGETSGIIETASGYHILRLNKHSRSKKLTFAEVNSSIRDMLQKDRLKSRAKAFYESLHNKAKVEVL